MKIATVYTSTTPELIELLEKQLSESLAGLPYELLFYRNPEILQNARDNGGITPWCTRELVALFNQAVADGADIILNVCSSVGDIAQYAKPLYGLMGVSFVAIDEPMALQCVKDHRRIGVIATLPTTLEPTKRLIQRKAEEIGKEVILVDGLADGAFGLDQVQFKQMLISEGRKIIDQVDALLFAQGSMAYAEEDVSKELGIPVYSSIRFGVKAVKEAAEKINKS